MSIAATAANSVPGFADYAWGSATANLPDSRAWIEVSDLCAAIGQIGGGLLPKARSTPGCVRFELPAADAPEPGTVCPLEIEVRFESGIREQLRCERGVDLPRYAVDLPADDPLAGSLTPEQALWLDAQSAVDRYVDSVSFAWDEEAGEPTSGGKPAATLLLPFHRLVHRWEQEEKSGDDARYALILRIAEQIPALLAAVCRRPRVILRRKRAMEKLGRVVQTDAGCIRWLVRQPGRSILEKAGREQKLLAVIRQEDSDTLENRVVRDFVIRAIHAADRYCFENRRFGPDGPGGPTERFSTVRAFATLLRSLLKQTAIGQIPPLVGAPQPNYVLMFDPRYKVLWYWYQKLRRLQNEQENIWRWRHRVWSEIILTNVLVAMDRIGRGAMSGKQFSAGHVYFRSDLQDGDASGQFVLPESPLPIFAFGHPSRTQAFEIVQVLLPGSRSIDKSLEKNSDLKRLLQLNPDFVIAATDIVSGRSELLGVWTEFTPTTQDAGKPVTADLRDHLLKLGLGGSTSALIVQPCVEAAKTSNSDGAFAQNVCLAAVSLNPRDAELQLRELIREWRSTRQPNDSTNRSQA